MVSIVSKERYSKVLNRRIIFCKRWGSRTEHWVGCAQELSKWQVGVPVDNREVGMK